jgi:hypothetical protein
MFGGFNFILFSRHSARARIKDIELDGVSSAEFFIIEMW